MYHSELTFSWNLDEFYTGFDDIHFHQDFLLLQKLTEKFVKNYKHTFRTFHTSEKLLWFYEENERILKLAEKIKYFIFYKNFLDFSSQGQEYLKKLNTLMLDFFQKFEKMLDECDENFYKKLENLVQKPEFEKYRFAIFRWIPLSRRRKKSWNIYVFFQNTLQIQEKIHQYWTLSEEFYQTRIDKNAFCESVLEIYFSLAELRTQNAKILAYQNFFEQQCEEYMISSSFLDKIIRESDEKYISQNTSERWKSDFIFWIDEAIDIIYNALNSYDTSLWDFFQWMVTHWKIFLETENITSNQAFTTGTLSQSPYIYMSFSWKMNDLFALVHEIWHAYQMQYSQNQSIFHFSASPFLWEFCAVFFEKILEKFPINQKYKKYDFSYYKQKGDILSYSREIFNIEKKIYANIEQWKIKTTDDCKKYISENSSSLFDFLSYQHIIHSPFYTATYIFAHTLVPHFFEKHGFADFQKIASKWGSESIDSIFIQYL